jgi:hypothetical protein
LDNIKATAVLASVSDGKPVIIAPPRTWSSRVEAGDLVKEVAQVVGGSGSEADAGGS